MCWTLLRWTRLCKGSRRAYYPVHLMSGPQDFEKEDREAVTTLVANLVGTERKNMAYGWYSFAIGVATVP
jgi:hypothetical protein